MRSQWGRRTLLSTRCGKPTICRLFSKWETMGFPHLCWFTWGSMYLCNLYIIYGEVDINYIVNVNYWPLGGYLSKWNTIGLYSIDLYTIPQHYAFEMWLWTQKMRWSHRSVKDQRLFQLHRSSCSCYGEGNQKALFRGAGKGCSTILNACQFLWNSSMPKLSICFQ